MAEAAYAQTRPGIVELKEIPASLAYQASSRKSFFAARTELFRRDFSFLRANSLSMTVPIEAEIHPGVMRFLVPEGGVAEVEVEGVDVEVRPPRTVVSVGLRGGYTEARFEKGVKLIEAWLAENSGHQLVGKPYVVYWDGPAKPGFIRRSEVHQEIAA